VDEDELSIRSRTKGTTLFLEEVSLKKMMFILADYAVCDA
jgi:hypothetical protein